MNLLFKYYNIFKKTIGIGNIHGRFLDIRNDDVFLVSYPKSGNTWLRFLLANVIEKRNVNFSNINNIVPDIHKQNCKELSNINSPRFIKSHFPYTKKYPRVVYLVRNPKDVLISYYHHQIKFYDFKGSINNYFDLFLKGKNSSYGKWDQHVIDWISSKKNSNSDIIVLKYEDLKNKTRMELEKILVFIGVSYSPEIIESAIKVSSFESMKNIEKKEDGKDGMLKASDLSRSFVRSGGGEWSKYFTENEEKILYDRFGEALELAGY